MTQFRAVPLALAVTLAIFIGCNSELPIQQTSNRQSQPPQSTSTASIPAPPEVKDSAYTFEPATRVAAVDGLIRVEEPGFACPTICDLDDDGRVDLVVGQFASGKMKWYRNMAADGNLPEYAEGQWIQCGDEPAEVPGVS